MSWACINVDPGLPNHPKIIQLEAKLGDAALAYVLRLWCWAAIDCPDGELTRFGSAKFLERRIMGWDGKDGELMEALTHAELLQVDGDHVTIRNWNERNPHLKRYRERQSAAAKARWDKHRKKKKEEEDNKP